RHTRFSRDWSSDVCSSDLAEEVAPPGTKSGVEVAVHPRMESGAAVVLLRWESAEAVAVHPTTKQGVVVAERPRRRVEAEAHCSCSSRAAAAAPPNGSAGAEGEAPCSPMAAEVAVLPVDWQGW